MSTRSHRSIVLCAALALSLAALAGCGTRGTSGPYTLAFHAIPDAPETGPVHLVFEVRDGRGKPARAMAVDVVAKIPPKPPLPEMEVTEHATEDRPGSYGVMATLARRGTWSIGATVRQGDKVLTSATYDLAVR